LWDFTSFYQMVIENPPCLIFYEINMKTSNQAGSVILALIDAIKRPHVTQFLAILLMWLACK